MNFLGLLWAISAIGSFWSPQDTPRLLDYFSKAVRGRTAFLANQVIARSGHKSPLLNYVTTQRSSRSLTAPPLSASRLWSPALASFIELNPARRNLATLAIHPVSTDPALIFSDGGVSVSVTQMMGSLFRRSSDIREAFRLTAPLITVVSAKNPCYSSVLPGWQAWSKWKYQSDYGTRTLELGGCTGLWRTDAALPIPVNTVFQIRVRGQVVAEVPTQAEAERIARQLHHVLRQPGFTPHSLMPGVVAGMPVGKAGDQVLFGIEPEWTELLDRNSELMAIDWINNLRVALNVPTLSLVEAQSQMHGLIPTNQRIQGKASWYGPYFHGRLTATGEIFDQHELTAAHPSLPFNTYLKVKNLSTQQTVIVRVNDRGPYFEDRSLDLSQEAARSLGSETTGVVSYEAVIMTKADLAQLQSTNWVASQAIKPQGNWAKQLFARHLRTR